MPQLTGCPTAILCLWCYTVPAVLPSASGSTLRPQSHPTCSVPNSCPFVPESPPPIFSQLQGWRTWSCWCTLPGVSTPSPSSAPTLTTEKCRVSRADGHWGAEAVPPQRLKVPLPTPAVLPVADSPGLARPHAHFASAGADAAGGGSPVPLLRTTSCCLEDLRPELLEEVKDILIPEERLITHRSRVIGRGDDAPRGARP